MFSRFLLLFPVIMQWHPIKFQGRGLGMAAAFSIVKNHNGDIVVDSTPGEGTTIFIYLPVIEV